MQGRHEAQGRAQDIPYRKHNVSINMLYLYFHLFVVIFAYICIYSFLFDMIFHFCIYIFAFLDYTAI